MVVMVSVWPLKRWLSDAVFTNDELLKPNDNAMTTPDISSDQPDVTCTQANAVGLWSKPTCGSSSSVARESKTAWDRYDCL